MPRLEWIGKNKVLNFHQSVPYQVLEMSYTYSGGEHCGKEKSSENKIIKGDNLIALKAILPEYENKVKCIYIDPPYNTGNENWIYNDNVNDPKLIKWLGEVVGKEGEDLSRHDKWLCMMYPRLKLLSKLLSNDGAIFISIDDNEQANLKLICDEIFGNNCFVANISWQRTYSPRNDSKGISNEIEHMLIYSKMPGWKPNKLPRTDKMNSKYKNPDNDNKPWRTSDAFAPGAATHQGMVYAIQHPVTGEFIYPYNGACWPLRQSDMLSNMKEWGEYKLHDLEDEVERASVCGVSVDKIRKGVKSIILDEPLEASKERAKKIYDRGSWPRFFFTRNGLGGIARKTYLEDTDGRVVTNLWQHAEVGHTDAAKKELNAIFHDKKVFDTPKPSKLIERIIHIATDKNSIILDSFAGSGTTAHAVLNMNKQDSGNRKFILVEMLDYVEEVTAERVKKIITGFKNETDEETILFDEELTIKNIAKGEDLIQEAKLIAKKEKKNFDKIKNPKVIDNHLRIIGVKKFTDIIEGTGGDFSFYELGEKLLLENGNLNENIETRRIQEYIFYMETRQKLLKHDNNNPYYLGEFNEIGYYFLYDKNEVTTLNYKFLSQIEYQSSGFVIYADLCNLPEIDLRKYNITFKKIPRDIARI